MSSQGSSADPGADPGTIPGGASGATGIPPAEETQDPLAAAQHVSDGVSSNDNFLNGLDVGRRLS